MTDKPDSSSTLGPSRAEVHARGVVEQLDGIDQLITLPASIVSDLLVDIDFWRGACTRRRQRAEGINTVQDIIALLPDDKAKGLQILDAARRMVVRFKR